MNKAIVFAAGLLSSVAAAASEPLAAIGVESVGARAGYTLEFGGAYGQPLRHSLNFTSGMAQSARPALEYRWTRDSSDLRIGGNSVMLKAPGVEGGDDDDDSKPLFHRTRLKWVYLIAAGGAVIATVWVLGNSLESEDPAGTGASN